MEHLSLSDPKFDPGPENQIFGSDGESHQFRLAQASKKCYAIANVPKGVVDPHQISNVQSQEHADLPLIGLSRLLRMICDTPLAARYLENVEIWGNRLPWGNSCVMFILDARDYKLEESKSLVSLERTYFESLGDDGRMFCHRNIQAMAKFLGDIPGFPRDEWKKRIDDGDEGPFKALLLAMLPGLESLKFVGSYHDGPGAPHPCPQPEFAQLLSYILPASAFSRLREVSVGIETPLEGGRNTYSCDFHFIVALYRLRALERLYLRAPQGRQAHLNVYIAPSGRIRHECSRLNHLYLEFAELEKWQRQQMLGGAPALESYVDTFPEHEGLHGTDMMAIFDTLAEKHIGTLRALDLWSNSTMIARLSLFYKEKFFTREYCLFEKLQHVSLSAIALLTHVTGVSHWSGSSAATGHDFSTWLISSNKEEINNDFNFADLLPPTLKTLTFKAPAGSTQFFPSVLKLLDDIIAHNLSSHTFPSLTTVFLCQLRQTTQAQERAILEDLGSAYKPRLFEGYESSSNYASFPRSVAAGVQGGVRVFTSLVDPDLVEREREALGIPMPATREHVMTDSERDARAFRNQVREQHNRLTQEHERRQRGEVGASVTQRLVSRWSASTESSGLGDG